MEYYEQVFPTFIRGVDFVGYRFFFDYTLLRKSTCKNFLLMNTMKNMLKERWIKMKDYGRVRSTVNPKPMVIDEFSVYGFIKTLLKSVKMLVKKMNSLAMNMT